MTSTYDRERGIKARLQPGDGVIMNSTDKSRQYYARVYNRSRHIVSIKAWLADRRAWGKRCQLYYEDIARIATAEDLKTFGVLESDWTDHKKPAPDLLTLVKAFIAARDKAMATETLTDYMAAMEAEDALRKAVQP